MKPVLPNDPADPTDPPVYAKAPTGAPAPASSKVQWGLIIAIGLGALVVVGAALKFFILK